MKTAKLLFAFGAVMLNLCACNTVQGIGKDVKKAGEVVENAAKK